jgi:GH18 family chitinase
MGGFSTMITHSLLGKAMVDQYNFNKWRGGFMLWQFSNDLNGTFVNNVMNPFRNAFPSLFS